MRTNKKLQGLSLFSNVGIAESRLNEIDVEIVIANELLEKRAEFYKHVYPDALMIQGDITDPKIFNQIYNEAKSKEIDFIIATPPCQGMSLAGKLDPLDERNQLIYYAIEMIKKLEPRFILLENVPQQLKTKIKHNNDVILIPEYIEDELSNLYNINDETLIRTMDYGIPQMRQRNIYLMVHKEKEKNINWNFPDKSKKLVTLKDALKNIPSLDPFLRDGIEETLKLFPDFEEKKSKGLQLSKWHFPPTHSKRHVEWLIRTPSGKTAFDNKIYFPKKENGQRINGHYNTYRRLSWEKPSRTITQNNGVISSLACVHPGHKLNDENDEKKRVFSDPRCFSIYELMIITSLPENWNIPPWANERMIRQVIGEGIPPLLIKKLFQNLLNKLNL